MRRLTISTETPRQRAWARSLRELPWRGLARPRTRCGLRPALARGITTVSLPPGALAGGNCVYRGGTLLRVLIPGGYATPKTGGFDYHYYVCDYLGSVRAVVAEDGTVEEANDYYPYGMQVPDSNGEVQRKQPYKFGGKERVILSKDYKIRENGNVSFPLESSKYAVWEYAQYLGATSRSINVEMPAGSNRRRDKYSYGAGNRVNSSYFNLKNR